MSHTLRAIALVALFAVAACKEKEFSGYTIESTSTDQITDQLTTHSVAKEEIEFILSEISGNYPLVTVIKRKENDEVILTIDEFVLEEWTNPTTGANGTTPHGTCLLYTSPSPRDS